MLERIVIYRVAIYIRLSKEDVDRGVDESESIINQKTFLTGYVEKLGTEYELVDIYVDQGYTGTNFNRPDFKRMIGDIRAGKVNMVITKDLSRLGRDYIETGEYIEKFFPENKVRYVSVTDGIDTFSTNNGNNDIMPFKTILNDMYSKDLSKKIKTAFHTMQSQGKWLGGSPPLGYKRNPEDKNQLVIDEEEAKIVRTIFDLAYAGKSLGDIRKYLNDNKIPTYTKIRRNKEICYWENKTIKLILKNPVYKGTTVQNKQSRISYKNRKIRANPEEQWITVNNTHEPIIENDKFDAIQKMMIVQKYSRNEKKNHFLLDGLLICYECKHKIGIRNQVNGINYMICNYYRRASRTKLCTSHGFSYNNLEKAILDYIKELFYELDDKKIEEKIIHSKTALNDYRKMLSNIELEIEQISNNIDKMYIEKLENKISEEMYKRLSIKLEAKIKDKRNKYAEIEELIKDSDSDDNSKLKKVIKEFLSLEKPTPELIKVIINRIEVHQDKQVDIVFNFKKLNYFSPNNCLF